MRTAPAIAARSEVIRQYARGTPHRRRRSRAGSGARVTMRCRYAGPMAGPMTTIPAAIAAGLGELGKHGSLIHRDAGRELPSRLVLTDVGAGPDVPDVSAGTTSVSGAGSAPMPVHPTRSSTPSSRVRREERWYVDFDKCLPYFNENHGCASASRRARGAVRGSPRPWWKRRADGALRYDRRLEAHGTNQSDPSASSELEGRHRRVLGGKDEDHSGLVAVLLQEEEPGPADRRKQRWLDACAVSRVPPDEVNLRGLSCGDGALRAGCEGILGTEEQGEQHEIRVLSRGADRIAFHVDREVVPRDIECLFGAIPFPAG